MTKDRYKFRVWDGEKFLDNNSWCLYNSNVCLVEPGSTRTWDHGDTYNTMEIVGDDVGIQYNKNYIIQQYTGLKDVNGIDIYVGDIIDAYYITSYDEVLYKNKEVTIEDGCFCVKLDVVLSALTDIEVVGNIFQKK